MKLSCVVLSWWTRVITQLSRPTEWTLGVAPKPWTVVNMTCQHWRPSCNKCATSVRDADNGKRGECLKGIWETSFCSLFLP